MLFIEFIFLKNPNLFLNLIKLSIKKHFSKEISLLLEF